MYLSFVNYYHAFNIKSQQPCTVAHLLKKKKKAAASEIQEYRNYFIGYYF